MRIEEHEANEAQLKQAIAMADGTRPCEREVPQWAADVRKAMPDWGFEIHCIRWLAGLDALLKSVRESTFYPCHCGRYGDWPGFLLMGVDERTCAVEDWLAGREPRIPGLSSTLGERSAEKEEAARCFVDITRAFVEAKDAETRVGELGKEWRKRAAQNGILKNMFHGDGFDGGLFGGLSYWLPHRLDLTLRIIGGDTSEVADLAGSCNYELRNVLRDDPQRMNVTLAYLWGLTAYLNGRDAHWLRERQPHLAGAAIHTLNSFAGSDAPERVVRWLAAALLATTRFWYQRALIAASQKGKVLEQFTDVPILTEE